jgi:hypothetical protein
VSFSAATWLACSALVGLADVLDAWVELKPRSLRVERASVAFGFFEFVWAGVSFMVWRRALDGIPPWVPVSYMAYVAACTAAGIVVGIQDVDVPEVRVPRDIALASGLFGVFFAGTCAWCWLALP